LKSFTSNKTEIRKSLKEGYGFFATKNIRKDEIVAIRSGHIVELDEAMKLDKIIGDFSLQISDHHFLCPKTKEEIEEIAIYINHSCDPNIGMNGQINYVAMRDIISGEELCLDYSLAMNTEYKLECNCGSKNCRKLVTGFDWKEKVLQQKYGKYFASFLLNKM